MAVGGCGDTAGIVFQRARARVFSLAARILFLNAIFLSALILSVLGVALPVTAQEGKPGVVGLGDLVVTGASGTIAPPDNPPLPPGVNALDETFIDTNGASLKVFDVRDPGGPPQGQVIDAPVKFQVFARDIGQVFGLALDKADPPNIYAASTSAHGLQIVVPDADGDGRPERIKLGQPGAQWMEGQFGTAQGGGPGTVWKINGETGEVTKFADIAPGGVANSGPGLGNIAHDAKRKQLFVSDLDTGLIHRLGMDGSDLGAFDHGLQGRPAGGLEAVQDDVGARADISSPAFDAEDSGTWGLTAPERRVWGLAVHGGRLYYAVEAGPQIWSVGINDDGSFGGDPRWELDVPPGPGPHPVSDITFRSNGQMLLAQRGGIISRYAYSQYHTPRRTRVLRYGLEAPDDPATPSRWVAEPEEYAIGFPGAHHNAAGGIAIGYGYRQNADGSRTFGACEGTLWSTGDALRDNPVHGARLAQGGPSNVHGLQGNPLDLARPQNEPPWTSYFIDYDSQFDDPQASGHVGDVEIPRECRPRRAGVPPADLMDLRILKRARPERCLAGVECAFEVEIINTGSQPYTGPLAIQDIAHGGALLAGHAPPDWSCTEPFPGAGVYECLYAEISLAPGESTSLEFVFQTPGWWNRPVYDNCAELRVPGAGVDQRLYNNRSCDYVASGDPGVPGEPDLQLEKYGRYGACDLAGLCEFSVIVVNVGAAPYTGPLHVTDFTTTAGATLVDWSSKPEWNCAATGPDSYGCSTAAPVTLTPGEFRELIILVQGPPVAPGVTHAQNCAFIDWDGAPGDLNPHNEFACAEISTLPPGHPLARPTVHIQKDAQPTCSRPGPGNPWTCVYLVRIKNSGTGPLNGPIAFTDEVTAHPATLLGWLGGPGAWACVPGIGLAGPYTCTHPAIAGGLPPGGEVGLLIGFELPPATPAPSWEMNCGTIKWDNDGDGADEDHEACAIALVCDAGSANCLKDVAVLKQPPGAACPKGASCPFSVTVQNLADVNYPGPVEVTDIPSPGTGPPNVLTPGWACNPAGGGSYTCSHPAAILPGNTTGFSLEFPVPAGYVGNTLENCAEVAPGANNVIALNDKDCATAVVPQPLPADLGPWSDTTCQLGQSCTLPARIDNKGETDFNGAAGVRGVLSPELRITGVASKTPGLTCAKTGNATYECKGDRLSVKAGSAAQYELTVSVPANYPHSQVSHIKNMIWPDSKVKDRNPENDQHISIITIEQPKQPEPPPPRPAGKPDLAVTKTANQGACQQGGPCGYTVTVTNAGAAAYTGTIGIVDTITPSAAQLTAAGPPPWSCSKTGGSVSCTHPSTTLAPGQSKVLSLTFLLPGRAAGAARNCAALSQGAPRTGASVRDVQSALSARGLDPGPVDGKMGTKTANAIRAFQGQQGLPVTGRIDAALLASLFGQPDGGDGNPANDRACASAPIIAQPKPPPPPPQVCTGGRIRNNAGACVCPSGTPVWTGQQCIPRPPSQCTGGRIRNNAGACVCPSSTPVWTGQQCIPRPPEPCSGGRIRNNAGACVCPPNAPHWNGQQCIPQPVNCTGGRVFDKNKKACACPSSAPIWTGQLCIPQVNVCSGGRVFSINQGRCVCPSSTPEWNGKQCVPKGPPPCTGGRIRTSSGQCICPRSLPHWNGQQCQPQTTVPTQPSGPSEISCSGGRVRNKNGQCVCPPSKPNWIGGSCVKLQILQPKPKGSPQIQVPGGSIQLPGGIKIR